jgi:hypothetical protein
MSGFDPGWECFAPDYVTARRRFLDLAGARGYELESHPIGCPGPQGEELTIDVASRGDVRPRGVVVVSSGLHGVEGYFGSAVQAAVLREEAVHALPGDVRRVLIHALNPFGFAWVRRANEENVDLNRNFLRPGEPYEGSPPRYAALDGLLNPKHPPRRLDALRFRLQSARAILRHGMPELKQAIAGGQYDFPRGLFFGGTGLAQTGRILAEHLPRWIGAAANVLHLDFHTGLGRWGTGQLLVDAGIAPRRFQWLRDRFGDKVRRSDPGRSIAFQVRGDLGSWCRARFPDRSYELLCAEFGTYPPVRVLAALRAENQAHHWGRPEAASTRRAKQRLMEMFIPGSRHWRAQVIAESLAIVRRGVEVCTRPPL